MTKIKCNYVYNPYEVRKGEAKPMYCKHRNEEGYCSLKEISMDEEDSGWVATCDELVVASGNGDVYC